MGTSSSSAAAAVARDETTNEGPAASSAPSTEAAAAAGAAAEGLQPGFRVRVRGLRSRPELNGCEGSIVEFDPGLGRWNTLLDNGTGLSLRAEALEVLDQAGDAAAAGAAPAAVDEAAGAGGTEQPGELATGARVRVCGLASRPELNGKLGSLLQFEDEHGRWKVIMDDGTGLALRPRNLEPLGASSSTATPANRSGAASCETTGASAASSTAAGIAAAGATAAVTAVESLRPGLRVRVRGLRSRPELNGSEGSLVEYDPELDRWRTLLDDGAGLSLKAESLEALGWAAGPEADAAAAREDEDGGPGAQWVAGGGLHPGAQVRIEGLQSRPELNDKLAEVLGFDKAEGRWHVRLEDGTERLLLARNVMPLGPAAEAEIPAAATAGEIAPSGDAEVSGETHFEAGARVLVQGLKSRPEVNGLYGYLHEFNADAGRWEVVMEDGSGLSLRPANLILSPESPSSSEAEGNMDEDTIIHEASLRPNLCVRVVGLEARADLNGKTGRLQEYDDQDDRWQVIMDTGPGLKLRARNLETTDAPGSGGTAPAGAAGPPVAAVGPSCTQQRPADGAGARQDEGPPPAGINGSGLLPGARARVVGLASRPDLNGQAAHLLEFVEADNRWKVLMDVDGSGKMLRPANLEPLPVHFGLESEAATESKGQAPAGAEAGPTVGSRVRVAGLVARKDLNGQEATVHEFSAEEGRWHIVLDSGSRKSLLTKNLEVIAALSVGDRVRVTGLSARAELNGQMGTLVEELPYEGRWKVNMDDGTGKVFRGTNLESCSWQAVQ